MTNGDDSDPARSGYPKYKFLKTLFHYLERGPFVGAMPFVEIEQMLCKNMQ